MHPPGAELQQGREKPPSVMGVSQLSDTDPRVQGAHQGPCPYDPMGLGGKADVNHGQTRRDTYTQMHTPPTYTPYCRSFSSVKLHLMGDSRAALTVTITFAYSCL